MKADSLPKTVDPAGEAGDVVLPDSDQDGPAASAHPTANCAAAAADLDTSTNALGDNAPLGPPYDQVIRSDFLGPEPLPPGRRLYLVILNYCLPAGLLHVWPQASFRICADGGCNRLHDELPALVPLAPLDQGPAKAAEAEADTERDEVAAIRVANGVGASVTDGAKSEHTAGTGHNSYPARDAPLANGNGNGTEGHIHGSTSNALRSGADATVARAASSSHHQHKRRHSHDLEQSAASAAGLGAEGSEGGGSPPLGSRHPAPAAPDSASSLRLAHMPDLVLGDLDSLRPDIRQFYVGHGVPFLDLSYDQDTNDLAKAIMLIQERFIDRDLDPQPEGHQILVLGALGGRLDHTLANLNVLHMFPHLDIALWGDGNLVRLVRPGTTLIKPDERFEGPTCGLIPIAGPVTGSSTGLCWNLADTAMRVGGLVSSSNLLAGGPVEVRCGGPVLWSTELHAEPRPDLAQLWARTAEAAEAHSRKEAAAGQALHSPGRAHTAGAAVALGCGQAVAGGSHGVVIL